MLSDKLSLLDDQVLRNVACQFIFLGLGKTLLESIRTLHDVLLVEAQVLIDEEDFRHGCSQAFESVIEVFAPLGVLSGGDSLRAEYYLEVLLDVLVVRLERVVHVEPLDPGPVDLDLVDIAHFVVVAIAFVFIIVLLIFFFLGPLGPDVASLTGTCIVVLLLDFLRYAVINLAERP